MRCKPPYIVAVFASLVLTSCSCESVAPAPPCTTDIDCASGMECSSGLCRPSAGLDASEDIDWGAQDGGPGDGGASINDPKNAEKDTDCDGLSDAEEFSSSFGPGRSRNDPNNRDTDGDGLSDGLELGRTSSVDPRCIDFVGDTDPSTTTDPTSTDSDGDAIPDGHEDRNHNGKVDPGETNPRLSDSDGDGLVDGAEDKNANGTVDAGETDPLKVDTDGDWLPDGLEVRTNTDPTKSDQDGDGCADGVEDANRNGKVDAGETDPRKPGDCTAGGRDTDRDGISDDVERTVTGTDPLKPDTDGDGLLDGDEDRNVNGKVDSGETSATSADTDCDGLSDWDELKTYRTNPLVPDSDSDTIADGVEVGATASPGGPKCPGFVADANPATHSDPLLADTDCDGLRDGEEDKNHDGKLDAGETDPARRDSDADGLGDGLEGGLAAHPDPASCPAFVGDADSGATRTNPLSPDTDGDGLRDGDEDANRNGRPDTGETSASSKDSDCDGLADGEEWAFFRCSPGNPDSDADGVVDGIEAGRTTSPESTCNFTPDADPATHTLPYSADSDSDGTPDGIEDKNRNGRVDSGETNPNLVDSDGDGCRDGDEDKNHNGTVEAGETNPLNGSDCPNVPDTDCDGLPDDVERNVTRTNPASADSDGDGVKDGLELGVTANPSPATCAGFVADANPATATDPLRKDTDCDGLTDGQEDANKNGKIDSGETDPTNPDGDGDGLKDGRERGATTNPDPLNCPGFVADADPTTKTDPTRADSDGDGVNDGAEDINGNGKVDPGELNPLNGADAGGPVAKACLSPRPVQSLGRGDADLQIAAVADFTQTTTLVSGGREVGMMLYDPTHKIVAFALQQGTPAANASAQEADGRAKLEALASITSSLTQGLSTWDGFDAMQAWYDQAGTVDLKSRANDVVRSYFTSVTGLLSGTTGVTGPFRIQAEYVRRSASRAIIVMAFIPQALATTGDNLFRVDDLGNGTALAQFGDLQRPVCEKFDSAPYPKVDFLWVLDNSGSMNAWLSEVANATDEMRQQLAVAPIDWRIATIYTDTDRDQTRMTTPRPFTRDLNQFKLDAQPCPNGSCPGISPERGFAPVNYILQSGRFLPASAVEDANKVRTGAKLVIVWITDAREQSTTSVCDRTTVTCNTLVDRVNPYITPPGGSWLSYFQNLPGGIGRPFVAGIVAPVGVQMPGEEAQTSEYHDLLTAMQGIETDMRNTAATASAIKQIIKAAIGFATPTRLSKPPISASLKVAVAGPVMGAACNKDDIPRSRMSGYDYDGASKTLVFYGDCRPDPAVPQTIAASYRYWEKPIQVDPPCGGPCPPPRVCDPNANACVCPPSCGGICTGSYTCDSASCSCTCTQSVTCGPNFKFDSSVCGCVCDSAKLNCGAAMQADTASCTCKCKANCGGTCTSGKVCDANTCGCVCDPATTCPPNQKLDPATCACVCDTASIVCPATQQPDAATCGCRCKTDCGGVCGAGYKCDAASCGCVCDLSAPCGPGLKRDPATCACLCDTSTITCTPPLVADPLACGCVCNPDCSAPGRAGCGPGFTCDPASCSCQCLLACRPGFKLDASTCTCACDTAALRCTELGPTYMADPNTCSCVCKPDCGGCGADAKCNASKCECKGGPN